jgi:hypothetical protein
VVVVGDLSKVQSELDQLGLGKPKMHDPDGLPMP